MRASDWANANTYRSTVLPSYQVSRIEAGCGMPTLPSIVTAGDSREKIRGFIRQRLEIGHIRQGQRNYPGTVNGFGPLKLHNVHMACKRNR